jgi:protocatechuate 3,4-dioxygenase beta subunit
MNDHLKMDRRGVLRAARAKGYGQRGAAEEAVQQATAMYEGRPLANPEEDLFDQGLSFDLETMLDRRRLLKLIGYSGLSVGLLALVGCGSSSGDDATGPATTGGATTDDCAVIPEETAGPFPGDGSNGPDVLGQSGVVRSDIRSSFGELSGTAEGVPLTIKLAVQDASNGCAALAGAAVYLWHCDRDGQYSLYSEGVTDQNYLRGVQEAGSEGVVTFTSIFPACYSGRWPHIHFEVYPTLSAATDDANKIATSQIALPEDSCNAVYATDGYSQSVVNLQQVSLRADNVFGDDGSAHQLGSVTGSVDAGYVAELAVPVLIG